MISEKTMPIAAKVTMAARKVFSFRDSCPRASASAISLESATGKPAVESVKKML